MQVKGRVCGFMCCATSEENFFQMSSYTILYPHWHVRGCLLSVERVLKDVDTSDEVVPLALRILRRLNKDESEYVRYGGSSIHLLGVIHN